MWNICAWLNHTISPVFGCLAVTCLDLARSQTIAFSPFELSMGVTAVFFHH